MPCLRSSRSLFVKASYLIAMVSVLLLGGVHSAEASITPLITYQARLWTAAGAPVPDGTYSMKLSLYSMPTGGTPIWTAAGTTGAPTAISVTVANGGFTVNLGDVAGGQNSLSTVDWDQSLLYLGVTVGSDAEMTPRRRLASVPQAMLADNARTLQGMYASSTAYGGQALFTIHQTEGSAATGTRTALLVRSAGTSDANDYLFRGVNSAGTTAFSIGRDGTVTSTGRLYFDGGTATSTILGDVVLGTNSFPVPSTFGMDGDDVFVGGALGVASSVHSSQGFVIGSNAASFRGDGLRSSQEFAVTSTVTSSLVGYAGGSSVTAGNSLFLRSNSGYVVPGEGDLSVTIGSSQARFLGLFGNVTTSMLAARSGSIGSPTVHITNPADNTSTGKAWGAYIDKLLVGNEYATGTASYVSVFGYDSLSSLNGVCIDNSANAEKCPNFGGTLYSLVADDTIGSAAFDLAELYEVSGDAEPGDILIVDPDQPMHMRKSPGVPYDRRISGAVSTKPGFLLGSGGDAPVVLGGRVPIKVTVANGVIRPGDPITTSERPGVGMKATRAGMILGRALQVAEADGTIEVFIKPGFDASGLLQADGSLTVFGEDSGFQAQAVADAAAPTQSSHALSFRGSAWDGTRSIASEFRLYNNVESAARSTLSISAGSASTTLFSLDQGGSLSLAGDLALAGKLYPSARGRAQRQSYIFVDDSVPGSPYISTNADGWQSQSGYDYAERYQSPDALTPGDVVVVQRGERLYVQRSLNATDLPIGIVSTKPGFIAGRPQEGAYPIALTGRVPTHVSTINGAIEPGDPLAPSTIPGVAVKATRPGPIVGLALEGYSGSDVGSIEVFVNPTWWGGTAERATEGVSTVGRTAQGFAEITPGKTRAHVSLPGFARYPHLQLTPYSQIERGWWIERVTSEGFDVVLGGVVGQNARFAWTATETADEAPVSFSSGRVFQIDPITGQVNFPVGVGDTDPPVSPSSAPIVSPEPTESVEEPEAVDLDLTATSTVELPVPIEEPVTEPEESEAEAPTSAEEVVAEPILVP